MRTFLAIAALAVAAVGCGSAASSASQTQSHPSRVAQVPGARPAHIAIVVMENEEYGDIVGSAATPYINSLARRYALATRMYAISHPSLPNYLALTGGSTFGIDNDCTDCSVHATSIADQLKRAHLSWKAYMEDLPHPCFSGASSGDYAKRHNPFAYYTPDASSCSHVVPLSRLFGDERHHSLPRFIWITPNLCHDMHDCSTATGDRFLARLVPPLLRSLGRHGLLFLTWDEGSTDDGCCRLASGGHIATVVAGPGARAHARMSTPSDHYSVLQTVEDLLGLPRLRAAACPCTPSLAPLIRSVR